MSTQSLNSESVLDFIKDNLDNPSFMSKIKNLITLNNDNSFDIPEWHKEHVLNVIANSKKEDLVALEDLDKHLKA